MDSAFQMESGKAGISYQGGFFMFCIQWDDSLSVGVHQFDEHHRHLVELLNKTYNACTGDNKADELESIVSELIEYTHDHIAAEEYLMERYAYPEASLHKLEHRMFMEQLGNIDRKLHETETNPSITLLDLAMLLGHWLSSHIMKIDKRLGTYLTTRGIVQGKS